MVLTGRLPDFRNFSFCVYVCIFFLKYKKYFKCEKIIILLCRYFSRQTFFLLATKTVVTLNMAQINQWEHGERRKMKVNDMMLKKQLED